MASWLIDETRPPDPETLQESARKMTTVRGPRAALAVRINDVVIHDTRKWFGGANIRLDAIVVHGGIEPSGANGFYTPTTFRFPAVRDGERLAIEDPGLLVFYGRPAHFVDLSILASRDRGDSEDLGQLVEERLTSPEGKSASAAVLGLALAAPQAAAIGAALGGAVMLANLAASALATAVGDSIGVYRASWLQYRDRFGLGRHPEQGVYRNRDLGFWYEVVSDSGVRRRRPRRDGD